MGLWSSCNKCKQIHYGGLVIWVIWDIFCSRQNNWNIGIHRLLSIADEWKLFIGNRIRGFVVLLIVYVPKCKIFGNLDLCFCYTQNLLFAIFYHPFSIHLWFSESLPFKFVKNVFISKKHTHLILLIFLSNNLLQQFMYLQAHKDRLLCR